MKHYKLFKKITNNDIDIIAEEMVIDPSDNNSITVLENRHKRNLIRSACNIIRDRYESKIEEFELWKKFANINYKSALDDCIELGQKLLKMENREFKKVKAKQDYEGHWYIIPNDMDERFEKLLSEGEKSEDEFIEAFDNYRTGGDVNSDQLYILNEEPKLPPSINKK